MPKKNLNIDSKNNLICLQIPSQVQVTMRDRRQKMSDLGAGATVQPYIITVSPDDKTLEAAYVCTDMFCYKFDTMVDALDVYFKAFIALDSKYPVESEHIWLMIQKALYGIVIPEKDNEPNSVKSFLKKLEVLNANE